MATLSLNEFLGHTSSTPKGEHLRGWKKKGQIDVWLSRVNPFQIVWRHGFSRMIEKDDGTVDVWGASFVCHDHEDLVKDQYKRNEDGSRIHPPQKCAFCKMLEWLSIRVAAQEIDWLEPIFKFEGDNPKNNRVYCAGGLLGLCNSQRLTEVQKRQMRQKGVFAGEAFKQVAMAKPNYVFCVVDNEEPAGGCKIMTETAQLGNKLKIAIRDVMTQRKPNVEQGDPTQHPYAFRFQYDAATKDINSKYHVVPMINLPLTEQIDDLISAEPPDTSSVTRPFNPTELRRQLEQAALIEMPWDEFFGESSTQEDDDQVACDECGEGMDPAATECPHCGHNYEPKTEESPPPPVKTRQQAKPAKKQASEFDLPDEEEEIPFK